MSVWIIYAIVLTGLYIIYYPVMILLDLFGKKAQKRDGYEVFNTGSESELLDEEEESGVVVSETAEGYSVGGTTLEVEEEEQLEGSEEGQEDPEPAPLIVEPVPVIDEAKERDQRLYETLLQEQLNPIKVDYQEEYDAASYLVVSQQPLNSKSRILRTILEI